MAGTVAGHDGTGRQTGRTTWMAGTVAGHDGTGRQAGQTTGMAGRVAGRGGTVPAIEPTGRQSYPPIYTEERHVSVQ
jgi:hypothetical protein